MTFDEAFDAAAAQAKAVTVDEPFGSYVASGFGTFEGRFRNRRFRWAPTPEQRIQAVEVCRRVCETHYKLYGTVPDEVSTRELVRAAVGVGPLTWLWIAVMVARLLAALKELLSDD